ncbi:MAG TPA: hypothetical protein ENK18_24150 [Deltaproteobacteria bacterium]|nr:hypothetical protein [Deltaproteobacteria bacterium]
MSSQAGQWRIRGFGLHLTLSDRTLRTFLRFGILTGTELARPERAQRWSPLFESALFTEEVAHLGDPAIAAHRRRAMRWFPLSLPLMAWLLFVSVMMIAEPPAADEVLPVLLCLGILPTSVLLLWTRWFGTSLAALVGLPPRSATTEAQEPLLLSTPVPELGVPETSPEQLRAKLEVVQRLRKASKDPDRTSALLQEEQALLDRIIEG